MADELKTVMASRLAIPLAAVLTGFLAILSVGTGAIVFATTVANQGQANASRIAEVTERVRSIETKAVDTDTRTRILEDRYANILSFLGDMKLSFEKLETRFNIK